jgi:hypothetical protein
MKMGRINTVFWGYQNLKSLPAQAGLFKSAFVGVNPIPMRRRATLAKQIIPKTKGLRHSRLSP